jgi:hypothetical protein
VRVSPNVCSKVGVGHKKAILVFSTTQLVCKCTLD